jgi:hypothetical protein
MLKHTILPQFAGDLMEIQKLHCERNSWESLDAIGSASWTEQFFNTPKLMDTETNCSNLNCMKKSHCGYQVNLNYVLSQIKNCLTNVPGPSFTPNGITSWTNAANQWEKLSCIGLVVQLIYDDILKSHPEMKLCHVLSLYSEIQQ